MGSAYPCEDTGEFGAALAGELVMFSGTADLVCHRRHDDCAIKLPHALSKCGRFLPARSRFEFVLDKYSVSSYDVLVMNTFAFNVTFTRPDENDANVYTVGFNATEGLDVAAARAKVDRANAHLTVRNVELYAVLDDDGAHRAEGGLVGVLKDIGQFCSTPNQPSLTVYGERQIEDCGAFGVFWYRRPTGHTKTGARHRGETPMVIEWAYVLRGGEVGGVPIWQIGAGRSGFATRADAIAAGGKS